MELQDSVALVTGATRGIGAAIADALAVAGVKRVYAAMRTEPQRAFAPGVVPVTVDITNAAQVADAARSCADTQILINNAGVGYFQPLIGAGDVSAGEEEMRVNYFGTLAMCRAFAPVLARNGGGAIVNILSIVARVAAPAGGSYCASKAAALSLTQAIRGELAPQGTLVISVMPGFVDTDMIRGLDVPKDTPGAVAGSVIQALRDGTEDVYPGAAAYMAAELARDAKAVEKQLAAFSISSQP
jgi:NAD(P)-dependent dehydrogenase (short-subunit alcohol dehydrogenase family)